MGIDDKVISPDELSEKLSADQKLVFTNGCFDILHPGHVRYLEEAARLGDELLVALNTDASVSRLKGPTRPVNSLADRAQVIAALASVRWVTWFDQDTPLELIKVVRPRVLVKGGDWTPDQIIGSDVVLAEGGEVRSLPFVEGKSTTSIIARMTKE